MRAMHRIPAAMGAFSLLVALSACSCGKQVPSDRTIGETGTSSSDPTVTSTRTVRGQVMRDPNAISRVAGRDFYLLRDPQGTDTPISVSSDMSRHVHVGDVVEAQVDPNGRVLAISKLE